MSDQTTAGPAEVCAFITGLLVLIAGAIGGAVLAFKKDETCTMRGYYKACSDDQPFVALGAGIFVGCLVQAVVLFALSAVLAQLRQVRGGVQPAPEPTPLARAAD